MEESLFSLTNPEFWVLVALVMFFGLLVMLRRSFRATLFSALDGHAAKIQAELDEARSLREEAKAMLDGVKAQRDEAEAQAKAMLAAAQDEAKRLQAEASAKLTETIARRAALAERKIANAQAEAEAAGEGRRRRSGRPGRRGRVGLAPGRREVRSAGRQRHRRAGRASCSGGRLIPANAGTQIIRLFRQPEFWAIAPVEAGAILRWALYDLGPGIGYAALRVAGMNGRRLGGLRRDLRPMTALGRAAHPHRHPPALRQDQTLHPQGLLPGDLAEPPAPYAAVGGSGRSAWGAPSGSARSAARRTSCAA